jgi:hypothetical protein
MPVACVAVPRGTADVQLPPLAAITNNPCGVPALATVGGVSVASENLCLGHWAKVHGLADLKLPITFQP